MNDSTTAGNEFLGQIRAIVEDNLSKEGFGVSELAREAGMSRSNLLRKVKKQAGLSVSRFVRQVRLEHALEILLRGEHTVSEVAFQVGFNSVSYFVKCFHEHYGVPPGEAGKIKARETSPGKKISNGKKKALALWTGGGLILALVVWWQLAPRTPSSGAPALGKSIAVLPFKNDSNDSTNVYLVNGLMESLLDNLQKIEGLRVISRTSVEKYRNNPRTIPEIAKELDVTYCVEGSGQKIGNQILLSIQLIEAPSDKHLWSERFEEEVKDIFKLQQKIANHIAREIEVIITPEEEERINKVPTEDLVAYDYFLKGLDSFYQGSREGLENAIGLFEKAIAQDPGFARAYADVAITYSLLDRFQTEKKHLDQINAYADQALLIDPRLPQSLIAKALFYINSGQLNLATPYLEKALEYNPNSALVINILSDFYSNYVPNTGKYLEYALRGAGLDIAAHDSIEASYIYLHIGNAFIQAGFTDEAEKYIDKSLAYAPDNLYSEYVKAFILYARDRDLSQTKERLIATLSKDTTRYDILQEIGKVCYYMRDYKEAYRYYKRFIDVRETLDLDVYRPENAKIGFVLSRSGLEEESERYFSDYKNYAESDESIYKHLSLGVYYSHFGDTARAMEQMRLFGQQENYHYWTILFLKIDPLIDPIKDLPEFDRIFREIERKFWERHRQIKAFLEAEKLI